MKKILTYLIGLFIMSVGVAVSIRSGLGVSPVSSLPYVISLIMDVYVGRVVTVVLILLVMAQIAILRKKFKPFNLAQLATSVAFGYFVDFSMLLTQGIHVDIYVLRLGLLAASIFFLSLGIAILIETKLPPLPFECLVAAIADVTGYKFHALKIIADSVFALASLALVLVFFDSLQGVREGTVLTALLVGKMIPYSRRLAKPVLGRVLPYEEED